MALRPSFRRYRCQPVVLPVAKVGIILVGRRFWTEQ